MTTTTSFDSAALRRGIETRDSACVAGLYADDATIEIVDASNGPSSPRVVSGRDAIRSHFDDMYGRDMSHSVERVAVASDGGIGYAVRCAYPDGTGVICSATSEVRDGRIVRELVVQAWDS